MFVYQRVWYQQDWKTWGSMISMWIFEKFLGFAGELGETFGQICGMKMGKHKRTTWKVILWGTLSGGVWKSMGCLISGAVMEKRSLPWFFLSKRSGLGPLSLVHTYSLMLEKQSYTIPPNHHFYSWYFYHSQMGGLLFYPHQSRTCIATRARPFVKMNNSKNWDGTTHCCHCYSSCYHHPIVIIIIII